MPAPRDKSPFWTRFSAWADETHSSIAVETTAAMCDATAREGTKRSERPSVERDIRKET
jgi:hypothetical protein